MKNIKNIAIYIALAFAVVACDNSNEEMSKNVNFDTISIEAQIVESITRSSEKSEFSKNDIFGLSQWCDDDLETLQAANMAVQYNGYSWIMAQTLTQVTSADTYNFAAIYPRPELSDVADLKEYNYTAPEDLLFATKSMSATELDSSDGEVSLTFEHLMARIDINITFIGFEGYLPSTLTLDDISDSAQVDTFTGDITPSVTTQSVDLTLTTDFTDNSGCVSRIIVPQTVTSVKIVVGDFTYSYSGTINTVSGKNTVCNFTLQKEEAKITLDGDVEITDWSEQTPLDNAVATSYWANVASSSYDGGDGSVESPYQIRTAAQLAYFAKMVNNSGSTTQYTGSYFILTDNIDLAGREWTPIANSSTVGFAGYFDGQDNTISNLTITNPESTTIAVSLFGRVLGKAATSTTPITTICNINIKDSQISIPSTSSEVANVGGVIGYINNNVDMYGCTVEGGNIYADEATSSTLNVGGVVGSINSANVTLSGCSVDGVTLKSAKLVGGIVGLASNTSSYIGCSANATLYGGSYVAGIIANDKTGATVTACYSAGTYSGGTSIGGLFANHAGVATSCYTIATADDSTSLPLSVSESGTVTECYTTLSATEIITMNSAISESGWSFVDGDNNPFLYVAIETMQ